MVVGRRWAARARKCHAGPVPSAAASPTKVWSKRCYRFARTGSRARALGPVVRFRPRR
jgi:hypothetical protein